MSDPLATTHLGLPYLSAAQAQKHVTHNEALRSLDALVQIAVLDTTETDPPATPTEGDRYIVAASATGAWSGHDGELAAYGDGAWTFFAPVDGWLAFDLAGESALLFHDGGWQPIGVYLGPLDQLGVNTTADATNRLAVQSSAVLFTGIGAAEGGTGDVRFTVNKEADADTASLLFQSGFSGRAEVGLAGDTDFVFKVSANGADWVEAIRIDKDSGLPTILYDNATSGLTADTVQDAIDEVAASAGAAVATVFGRTGAVTAAASDYDASQVDNDSGVAGATVAAALDALDADKQAAFAFTPRDVLSADRTYYADATDGSDSNDGLASGSGNAFATLQHALDVCATIDFNGYTVTIQLADDTYTRASVPVCVGQAAPEDLVIQGNASTPSNVIVDSDSGFIGAVHVLPGAQCVVKDLKTTTSDASAYDLSTESSLLKFSNIVFAGTGTAHLSALRQAVLLGTGDYEIAGAASQHIRCNDQGCFRAGGLTVTITGTPNFSSAFLLATLGSTITYSGHTFVGSATGKRYSLTKCSAGTTGATPDTYLPGDVTGSVDSTSVIS
jgi:Protein of unknown function (DUF2793)